MKVSDYEVGRSLGIQIGRKIAGGAIALVLLIAVNMMVFSVTAHEIVVLTYPSGRVEFFTQPGVYCQCLGHVESFEKRQMYEFEEGIQFIDGAHATIKGSVQWEAPLDRAHLSKMYERYPTPEAVQKGLIETNIQKAVYLTGQMMTSKESYAEKRSDLLRYIEDQAQNGVYQTRQKLAEIPDQLDEKKTRHVTVVEIAIGQNGLALRQEQGVLQLFGLNTSNFTMKIAYDEKVEKQIQSQQTLAQDINLSIADAKKAEQRAITTEKNGQADAAQAKWDQEKINARIIAEAEQRVTTAKLDRDAAALKKQQSILEGEGQAEKNRLIMNADGALQQKLAAWVDVQKAYANAIQHYGGNWVPTVVTGGAAGTNAATSLLDAIGTKALRDLSLEMAVPHRGGKQ